MKVIQIDELRELQMQILDYVDAFCRKHDIKYTLSGGSLLGAVRHGGFIPWDDDMDIQMLRDEYNRFTELWNVEKNTHPFELVNIESGNAMGYPIGKVHNPKTVTFSAGVERTGVFVDIFPVDKVLDDEDFSRRRKSIKWLKKQEGYAFVLDSSKSHHVGWMACVKAWLITLGHPRTYFAEKINNLARCKNSYDAEYVFEMVAGMKCKRPIRASVFDEYADVQFENRKYMAVKDYDAYLTATFGDYMTPPPPEKQVKEHDFSAFWR